jgi:FdhD protein
MKAYAVTAECTDGAAASPPSAGQSAEFARLAWSMGAFSGGSRELPEEVPVAFTYDGSAGAVMMATPADLEDFAIGFSISEGVIDGPSDLESLLILAVEGGLEARMWLRPSASQRQSQRRRRLLGPTGCGLCGVEGISEALKPARPVASGFCVAPQVLLEAMAALQALQALNQRTRAVHAAGLYRPGADIVVREDVGRHNALDKVIGASAPAIPVSDGIVLLTSRVSVELVQKTASLGAPIIAAISAPTALAVRAAEESGITLAAVVRGDCFEIFTHPGRIVGA